MDTKLPLIALGLLLLTSCGSPRKCSILVDCTCNCTNGSTGQVSGRACLAEEEEGSCDTWAEPKKQGQLEACVQACAKNHGDSTAQCQLASLPGNPVVTIGAAGCPVR